MGTISPSTFDPLKTRVNVRMQQGIPVVDADLNELDDIRKFELRAFLKWFVGDGVPAGCDAFRIEAVGAADDLVIRAGVAASPQGASGVEVGLRHVGRCIVDGLDVIIPADVRYKGQLLFQAPGPGPAEPIQPIPSVEGPVLVYLDVWERLLTPQDDPTLVHPGIGTESCARVRREWAVRTLAGTALPVSTEAHSYCALARVNRHLLGSGEPAVITAADVVDLRHRDLQVSSLETRVDRLERMLLFPVFVEPGSQVVPASGLVGAVVTLHGRNFDLGAPQVTFGAVAAAIHGAPTATEVRVVVPNLSAGAYVLSIRTDGGGPTVADDPFTVQGGSAAPTIGSLGGTTSAGTGEAVQLLIRGTHLADTTQVGFAGTGVTGTIQSAAETQLEVRASVAAGAARGDRAVTVTTPAGSATGGAFRVLARPAISSVNVTGVSGNVASVEINGANLAIAPVSVTVNDPALTLAIVATAATRVTLSVTIGKDATTGTKTFTVTTADGTANGSVTVTQPCSAQGTPARPCSGAGNPDKPCSGAGNPHTPCSGAGNPDKPCIGAGTPDQPCSGVGKPDNLPCPAVPGSTP